MVRKRVEVENVQERQAPAVLDPRGELLAGKLAPT